MKKTKITISEMIKVINNIDEYSLIGQRDRAILSLLTTIRHNIVYKSYNVFPRLTLSEISNMTGFDFMYLFKDLEYIENITENISNWITNWCKKYYEDPAFPRFYYYDGIKMFYNQKFSNKIKYLSPKYISKIIDRRIRGAGIDGSFGIRSFF